MPRRTSQDQPGRDIVRLLRWGGGRRGRRFGNSRKPPALERLEGRLLLSGTLTGTVFEDYNDNGVMDTTATTADASTGTIAAAVDRGLAGVVVTSYDGSGVVRGTATTGANGTYSITETGTGPYRVQFTSLPSGFIDAAEGTGSGSTVQFVANGNATANLGVETPTDYSANNPTLASTQFVFGDNINGTYANMPVLETFGYNSGTTYGGSGDATLPTTHTVSVAAKSLGTTFGLGYNSATRTIYASSYMKRFAGYGPNAAGTGTTDGAIYAINRDTGVVSVLVDLNAVFGANTAGVDYRTLPTWTGYTSDGGNTGWDAVGKTSLGGMAVSPDGSTIYVMNLANRTLYAIPTSGPENSTTIKTVQIPLNAPGATGVNGADLRPFAVTYYNGSLYVGIVNSAQSTQNAADLKAYVYAVNPTTLAFGSSPIFQTSLNYTRGIAAQYSGSGNPTADWQPWSSTFKTLGSGTTAVYAQPMLSSITFDAVGNMDLGLRDRNADENGFFDDSNPASPNTGYEGISAGDTLRAFINTPNTISGGFTLESDARGPAGQGSGPQNAGTGPGGGLFYYQQSYSMYHSNVSTGGLLQIPGFPDVVSTTIDPSATVRTGGLRWYNDNTGATDKGYQLYNTGYNQPPQATFGKAAGDGEVVALNSPAPIEVGDRIFLDTNDNGIQDPGEPGIAGVTVHLYQGSTLVGTTTTNASGIYLFNASDVSAGLLPNTAYQIRLDNATDFASGGALAGRVPTIANADPTGLAGSKAVLSGGVPIIAFTTGAAGSNDHTLDAGFVNTASLAGFSYVDANDDGVKQSGEAGISGVTVTLTGTDDQGNPVNLTTTTASDGSYSFTGLRPSNPAGSGYTLTESPPTGYLQGIDTVGTPGGTVGSRQFTGIVLTQGTAGTNNDFGELLPASVAGFSYVDANNDGTKEAGEAGISGVTVTLTGTNDLGNPVSMTTQTLGDGSYSFSGLRPSNASGYTVTETAPGGYLKGIDTVGTPGGAVGNRTFTGVVLNEGVAGANNNFGELLPSSLAGVVYIDVNNDGVKQASEAGISGVVITLTGTDDQGNPVNLTTTTASDGSYSFTGLRPSGASGYTLTESTPGGTLKGKDTVGTQGGTVGSRAFTGVVLNEGVAGTANNFGELLPASLAGLVYVDTNDDGVKQAGESGIAGITVTLTGTDDQGNAVNLPTTTAADGSYSFTGLRPSNASGYTITESVPAGYLKGKDTPGTPGGTAGNRALSGVVLNEGVAGANNDFGELSPSSLAGFVYVDANNDGVKQAGESGLAGVTVTLTGTDDLGASVNTAATTAADGSYTFAQLRPGNYTLTETPPAGYGDGKDAAGTAGGTPGTDVVSSIALGSGTAATGYTFAETGGSIAGTVFVDVNDDGAKQSGEPGIAGVTVKLFDSSNNLVATTATANDGTYSFANLPAGSYKVVETVPAGYGTSTASTVNLTLAKSGAVVQNFGDTTSSLAGVVFIDANKDNADDAGDSPAVGDTVTLTGTDANGHAVSLSTTSAADGTFSFTGLLSGTYSVIATPGTGFAAGTATPGTAGGTATSPNDQVTGIALPAGTAATGYLYPETGASVAGLVFVDTNGNGSPDPGEPGKPGVVVTLTGTGANAGLTYTATADANGDYTFAGIPTGPYTLSEAVPTGYGTDTPTSISENVTASGLGGQDFGLTTSSLAGSVYLDKNNDGVQQSGEPGLAGVTITLTGTDAAGNTVNLSATTAADGSYSIAGLLAGNYTLTETPPAGYGDGKDVAGTAGGTTGTETVSSIALGGGTAATGYTFAEIGASISGTVFDDANGNGTLDNGESGLAGVTVTLLDSSNHVLATTTTANDGTYSFANLPAGDYQVRETVPTGYGTSTPGTVAVTLPKAGAVVRNFGDTTSSLAGFVYIDVNDDHSHDAGDLAAGGTTVTLTGTDANGHAVSLTTTSASDGTFSFNGLLSGTYSVAATPGTGLTPGTAKPGTAGGTAGAGNDQVTGIALPVGTAATDYEYPETGVIVQGVVFIDTNRNQADDPGEPGLSGVTVKISQGGFSATTTTGANGTYSFSGIASGTYTITETPPGGYGTDTPTALTVNVPSSGLTGEDFGVTASGIAGLVYVDLNNDGSPEAGEPPIAGVTVQLFDSSHNLLATTTTANDGTYLFPNLIAGTYTVQETQPSAYNEGQDKAGSAGGSVAVIDVISGIPLPAGTAATGYDFGERGSTVSGTVYIDANDDGAFDAGDSGLGGVTVTLLDSSNKVLGTTTSAADGAYSFTNVAAGNDTIRMTQPNWYGSSTPTSLSVANTTNGLTGEDFGLTTSGLAGFVYLDKNDDGVQQSGEPGLGGVTITLTGTDAQGNSVDLTTTSANDGSYSFLGLAAGTYALTETPPSGYGDGKDAAGTAGGTVGTDVVSSIALGAGTSASGYTFAETGATVAGSVFYDANGDGSLDNGESGLAGVTVTLLDSSNNVVATATTAADGSYSFANLPTGQYSVVETPPTGYGHSTPVTRAVTLGASGATVPAFGDTTASLAGFVYVDVNKNGAKDAGDTVAVGDTVTLTGTDANGHAVSLTTTSASDGTFSFTGLLSGTYSVVATPGSGFSAATATAGSAGGTPGAGDDQVTGIMLPAGTNATGYQYPETGASVGGLVFVDTNGNGAPDSGEPGKPGVVLTLTGTGASAGLTFTATTDSGGGYSFAGIPTGSYTLSEATPKGYGTDTPTSLSVTVTANGLSGEDFGLTTSGLAGLVYLDKNNDGVVQSGEPGLPGVTVTLTGTDANGNPVHLTATTAADGTYALTGLLAGTYTLTETPPTGYSDGKDAAGTAGGTVGTDVVSAIALGSATSATGYDFAETGAAIKGTVFHDADGNGVQGSGESGLAGVTVTLLDSSNNLVATTTTANDGTYSFANLPVGTYTVVQSTPPGYGNSTPASRSVTVTTAGVTGENFGDSTSSLAGVVYDDVNKDGVFDTGDVPGTGLNVTLTGTDAAGDPVSLSTTVGNDGSFLFTDLLSGNYTVTAAPYPGIILGTATVGTAGGVAGDHDDQVTAIPLGPGFAATGYGFPGTGVPLTGTVFFDANRDGTLDNGETGPSGVTVTLKIINAETGQPIFITAQTDAQGDYNFQNVPTGSFTVIVTVPDGDGTDTPTTLTVNVPPGGASGQNFGLTTASLSGLAYQDANDDGVRQSIEASVAGVTVALTGTDVNGASVSLSTTTAADGSYAFAGLVAGTYTLTETRPAAYLDGTDSAGSLGGTVGVDVIRAITVTAGAVGTDYDFAEVVPSSLSGFIYSDLNNNGVKDSNEAGVGGGTVTLTGTNDEGYAITLSATTAADGSYSFTGLRPSDAAGYTLTETNPAGYLPGKDAAGSQGGTAGNDVISKIVLTPGINGVNNNFGVFPAATIDGSVFVDANDDRTRDDGEAGVGGVTVTLTGTDDQGNAVHAVTTTASDGSYTFTGLRPSSAAGYTVTKTQPAGYLEGLDANGGPSDGTLVVILRTGRTASANDFPVLLPATLGGYVYSDLNDDGARGAGEPGIAGVTITLTGTDDLGDAITLTTTTDAHGVYAFPDLRPALNDQQTGIAPGYTLTETPPAGYFPGHVTVGSAGGFVGPNAVTTIYLPEGFSATNNNFGEIAPSSLSGFVYADPNDNGVKDAGEAPVPGAALTLTGTDDLGHPVSLTTTTAADGSYRFTSLRPGTYKVALAQPSAFLPGKEAVGSQGGAVGDHQIDQIVLPAATNGVNNNFGELTPSQLAGFAYFDDNDNALKDPTEPGVAGETITLTGTDDLGDAVSRTLTTGDDGGYDFTGLRPGTYTLTSSTPSGNLTGQSTPGTPGGVGSPETIGAIVVTAGTDGAGNDFGVLRPPLLAGFVYVDANHNGVKDADEPGIPGVTVTLTGTDGQGRSVSRSMVTLADGSYAFPNLPTGMYQLTETGIPAGLFNGSAIPGTNGGTAPTNALIENITVGFGSIGVDNDFTLVPAASLSGFVYFDSNDDGVKDPSEMGVLTAILALTGTDDLGAAVRLTTTSASDGGYAFTDLRPGTYSITETLPAGDLLGKVSAGSLGGAAGANQVTNIVATSGAVGLGNDFGVLLPAGVSGTVYLDANGDGARDGGESGIGGVVIRLTGTDDRGTAVTETVVTGADGSYGFGNLRPGTYTLTKTPPAGFVSGTNAAGSQGGAVAEEMIGPFTLGSGQVGTGNAFAEVDTGSLSGVVYYDLNHNGVNDAATDFGIVNVTVTLDGADDLGRAVHEVTRTDADGAYTFANLVPGVYSVVETHPAHFRDYVDNPGSLGGTAGRDVITGVNLTAGAAGTDYNFGELQAPGCNLRNLAIEVGNRIARFEAERAANPAAFDAKNPVVGPMIGRGEVPKGVGGFPRGALAYSLVPTLGTKPIPFADGKPVGSNPVPIRLRETPAVHKAVHETSARVGKTTPARRAAHHGKGPAR